MGSDTPPEPDHERSTPEKTNVSFRAFHFERLTYAVSAPVSMAAVLVSKIASVQIRGVAVEDVGDGSPRLRDFNNEVKL